MLDCIDDTNIGNDVPILVYQIDTNVGNKGEFCSRPISAFVYVLALSQSKCVICEIYKQTHALKFEQSCKRIFIFISPN